MTGRQTRGLLPAAALAFLCLTSACGDDESEPERDEARGIDAGNRDTGARDSSVPDPGRMDAGRDASIDAALRDASSDSGSDAAQDASSTLAVRLSQLAQSRTAWETLAATNPGPYWFEEENCALNTPTGGSRVLQINGGTSQQVRTYSFPRNECEALVNRYETQIGAYTAPETFPELYTVCEALLNSRSDTRLSFDAQNVVKACWVGDALNCSDNCGRGFYLREWGFGASQPKPDGGVRPDAGVYVDAGVRSDAG